MKPFSADPFPKTDRIFRLHQKIDYKKISEKLHRIKSKLRQRPHSPALEQARQVNKCQQQVDGD